MSTIARRGHVWEPAVDVLLGSGLAWIRLAAPGAGPGDVRVTMRGCRVIVAGRATLRRAPEGVQFLCAEIVAGAFRRRIELPWEPHPRRIEVRAADGIVEIAIWRRDEEGA